TSASADPASAEVSTEADPQPDAVPSDKPSDLIVDEDQPSDAVHPVSSETAIGGESTQVPDEHASDANSATGGGDLGSGAQIVDQAIPPVEESAPETETAADPGTVAEDHSTGETRMEAESGVASSVVEEGDEPKAPEEALASTSEQPVADSAVAEGEQ
ncbi:hypothetical protein EV175_007432, partial [Coemansia sp. RSA 1933]